MSRNFSAPKSAPKPASVTTISPNLRPNFVATMELQPWAMFANGPPWTMAGVCSNVCTRFGLIASFIRRAIAPWQPSWCTYTGSPAKLQPITIRPKRSFKSSRSLAKQRIAIISEATVIMKWSSRGKPHTLPPSATVTLRSARSFISRTRVQDNWRKSICNSLPWWMWLSIIADNKLLAAVMACISPVKWRLISSIGTTWA